MRSERTRIEELGERLHEIVRLVHDLEEDAPADVAKCQTLRLAWTWQFR
jgi:hypothetical protein